VRRSFVLPAAYSLRSPASFVPLWSFLAFLDGRYLGTAIGPKLAALEDRMHAAQALPPLR